MKADFIGYIWVAILGMLAIIAVGALLGTGINLTS